MTLSTKSFTVKYQKRVTTTNWWKSFTIVFATAIGVIMGDLVSKSIFLESTDESKSNILVFYSKEILKDWDSRKRKYCAGEFCVKDFKWYGTKPLLVSAKQLKRPYELRNFEYSNTKPDEKQCASCEPCYLNFENKLYVYYDQNVSRLDGCGLVHAGNLPFR